MIRPRAVTAVARHDLLDLRRQRGVWVGLLLIPFVTVSFLLLLPGVLAQREQTTQARATYRVAVEVDSAADAVVDVLRKELPSNRFRVVASRTARRDVERSRADVGLRLDGEGASAVASLAASPSSTSGDVTQVVGQLLVLGGRSKSRAASGALTAALERFGLEITDRHLAARGVAPSTVRPFVAEVVDLSGTARGQRLNLATLLPLLVLLPVAGTVGVAAQRISGSKDQRVFEPLLALPFTRRELLVGKALGSLLIGSITLVAVAVPLLAGRFVPVGAGGRQVQLPLGALGAAVGIGTLLLVLLVMLGMAVGAAARTSAELGSVLQMVTLPIFLLGSFLQFRSGIVSTAWLMALPFFGPLLCVRDVAIGALTGMHLSVAAVSTLAWASGLLLVATRLVESERSVLRSST
jgi:ABC-type Na+ efflux pump permease subunit